MALARAPFGNIDRFAPVGKAETRTLGSLAQGDALASLRALFAQLNIPQMADWAWAQIRAGKSQAEILLALYETKTFKREFPEVEARRAAGLTPLSPGEIVAWRHSVQQIGASIGLSPRVLTKEVMQRLLIADKSPAEIARRLTKGYAEIVENAPEVADTFKRWFGAQSDAAIAAIALDPTLGAAEVERMAAAAQIGGFGTRFGFDFAKDRALELAKAGVTGDAAREGIGRLGEIAPLFSETIGENKDLTAEDQGAEFVFGLGSGRDVKRRGQARQASSAGGGGAAESKGGIIGLGAAE